MASKTSTTGLTSLSGIGPKTISWLAEIGITDVKALRELGAVGAYRRLKHWDPKLVSRNALWGLYAALNGIHWTEIPKDIKDQLLRQVGEGTGPVPNKPASTQRKSR